MKKHKIISKTREFVYPDSYAFVARCSCGKEMSAWFVEESEDNIKNHLLEQSVTKTK